MATTDRSNRRNIGGCPSDMDIAARDNGLQNAIDLLQLVRVIEVGMDVNGDGSPDVDPNRISYFGNSGGGIYGAVFLALEPNIYAAAAIYPGNASPEHGRWAPGMRANLGQQLRDRVPSLLNAPGITMIDGVPINPPHFNENKPLRDQPPVINEIDGAMDIQKAMELAEWGRQGSPRSRGLAISARRRLPGLWPKSLLFFFGKGDQNAINPGTSAILRAGNLADRRSTIDHDLAFTEDPTIPRNPHFLITGADRPNALFRSIVQGVQRQIAAFFASDGTVIIHPNLHASSMVPLVGPLPET